MLCGHTQDTRIAVLMRGIIASCAVHNAGVSEICAGRHCRAGKRLGRRPPWCSDVADHSLPTPTGEDMVLAETM